MGDNYIIGIGYRKRISWAILQGDTMRIDISIQDLISCSSSNIDNAKDMLLSKLDVGDIIKVLVLESLEEGILIKLSDDSIIHAHLDLNKEAKFSSGEFLDLKVNKIDGKQVILEPVKVIDNNIFTDNVQFNPKVLEGSSTQSIFSNTQFNESIKFEINDLNIDYKPNLSVNSFDNAMEFKSKTLEFITYIDQLIIDTGIRMNDFDSISNIGITNNIDATELRNMAAIDETESDNVNNNNINTNIKSYIIDSVLSNSIDKNIKPENNLENKLNNTADIKINDIYNILKENARNDINKSGLDNNNLDNINVLNVDTTNLHYETNTDYEKDSILYLFQVKEKLEDILNKFNTDFFLKGSNFEQTQELFEESLRSTKLPLEKAINHLDKGIKYSENNSNIIDINKFLDLAKSFRGVLDNAAAKINIRYYGAINNYIEFPIQFVDHQAQAKLYVMKRKRGTTIKNRNSLTAYLSLHLQNIGKLESFITLKYNNVYIDMKVENSQVVKLIKDNYKYIYDSLLEKGYRLADIKSRIQDTDINLKGNSSLNVSDFLDEEKGDRSSGLDIKI